MTSKTTNSSGRHAAKRTPAQRAADQELIGTLCLKGKTQTEIVEVIGASRPYRISRAQVCYDIDKLKRTWMSHALADRTLEIARALKLICLVEKAAWEEFEKASTTARTTGYACLKIILEAHDRKAKLIGLNANDGSSLAAMPPDTASVLTEEESDGLVRRHLRRMIQAGHFGQSDMPMGWKLIKPGDGPMISDVDSTML